MAPQSLKETEPARMSLCRFCTTVPIDRLAAAMREPAPGIDSSMLPDPSSTKITRGDLPGGHLGVQASRTGGATGSGVGTKLGAGFGGLTGLAGSTGGGRRWQRRDLRLRHLGRWRLGRGRLDPSGRRRLRWWQRLAGLGEAGLGRRGTLQGRLQLGCLGTGRQGRVHSRGCGLHHVDDDR